MSRTNVATILVTGVVTLVAAAIGAGAGLGGSWLGGEYQSLVRLQTRLVDARGVARVLEHDLYERAKPLAATKKLLLPREARPSELKLLPSQIPRYTHPDIVAGCLQRTRSAPSIRCRVPTHHPNRSPTSRKLALSSPERRQLAAALPLNAWDMLSNALDDYNSVRLQAVHRITRSQAARMIRALLTARYALSVLVHYRTDQEECPPHINCGGGHRATPTQGPVLGFVSPVAR